MKFRINKNLIQNVLSRIQGLTSRKSNLIITSCVMIESSGSQVKISATDLETGLEGFYDAAISMDGKIAVNAKKLYEIVRDFPSDEILINEIDNYWIEITDTNIEYHLVGLNPDDFPLFPIFENISYFSMSSEKLRKMIDQTIVITAAGDEKRIHILGSLFDLVNNPEEKAVRIVATDGNRLSTADIFFESNAFLPESASYIVPKKALVELNKFLSSEATLQVGFKDNYMVVKKDRETIVIRLLEGEFPKYREILKHKGQGHVIKLDKQKFLMMLRRMSILSTDDYKGVIFKFSENNLHIESTNPEIGESKEEMEMDYKGGEIQVAFNPKFFMDALNSIEDQIVEINIINEEKPCFIEGEEDKNFLSVIMPMRI
jgi:DNA polymerase III subunit beta